MSNQNLDANTIKSLNFGLSFHIKEKLNPVESGKSLIYFERSSNLDQNELNICRGLDYNCLNEVNLNFPARFTKVISKLKQNKNIYIKKADKSNNFILF